jgi:hypothetical protein
MEREDKEIEAEFYTHWDYLTNYQKELFALDLYRLYRTNCELSEDYLTLLRDSKDDEL